MIPVHEAALRRAFADDPATLAALDATQPTDAPVEPDEPEPEPQAEPRMIRRTYWDRGERERRADIAVEEFDGSYMPPQQQALWDRWATAVATKAADDLIAPEIADVAAAMSELAADLDTLIDEVAQLRAEVQAMRGQR
jgi:hypothetical protein